MRTRNDGVAAEKRVSRKTGFGRTKGSGAQREKCDHAKQNVRIETKSTERAAIVIQRAWFVKLVEQANMTASVPVLALVIGGASPLYFIQCSSIYYGKFTEFRTTLTIDRDSLLATDALLVDGVPWRQVTAHEVSELTDG